jgi:hypothetical protein
MAIKGWVSPSTSVRKAFDQHASVVDPVRGHPDNREVTSKNTRRYGRNETTGDQPAEVYRDEVPGEVPVIHRNETEKPHKETVGWMNGEFRRATHPNAERRAAGGVTRTHAPLEPVGMTHSKTGGEHGKPQMQKVPESRGSGGVPAPHHGKFNHPRDRNR